MTTAIDTPQDFTDEELRYLALAGDGLGKAPKLDLSDRHYLSKLSSRIHDERAVRSTVLPAFVMTMPLTVSEDDLPRAEGARARKSRAEGKKPFQLNLAPSLNVYAGLDPWVLSGRSIHPQAGQ